MPSEQNWGSAHEEEGEIAGYSTNMSSIIIPTFLRGSWKLRKVEMVELCLQPRKTGCRICLNHSPYCFPWLMSRS